MTTTTEAAAVSRRHAALRDGVRTILVHVQPDPDSLPRLDAAVALARKADATLFGLGAQTTPPFSVGDPYGLTRSEWLGEMRELMRVNLERSEALFRKTAVGVETDWLSLEETPVSAMARESRGADLIVAGGSKRKSQAANHWCDPADLVLKSGRPVLILPPAGLVPTAEAVVVGWKDTREARRALADAMPFLRSAQHVVVLEVSADGEVETARERTEAVVVGLKRHGVRAKASVIASAPHLVSSELQFEADRAGADLIVAGAYSHSRFGEQVFGGVTRDLLNQDEISVLMSR